MQRKLYLILIPFVLLLFLTNRTFGQSASAPTLGATSGFALFTTAGAITNNAGTTSVWGDIGYKTGSFVGTGTLTHVVGTTYYTGTTATAAATDLDTAYSYLSRRTCDSTMGTPFGSGRVLKGGTVYCITSAADLNGDLILDAKGNANAIFNIKINGALSTATSSRVILINSARQCNVYWQIGGAANLGANSIFRGTMLVDGAISLLNYDTLEGRALTKAGAINITNNKVVGLDGSGNPLPVKLISFIASPVGNIVNLNWSTASELNNDYFTVERTKDGIIFEEVIRKQGAGNSNTVLQYSAIDYNPYNGKSYYRLKQTDFNGEFSYSDFVAVNFEKQYHFAIFPNPFTTTLTVTFNDVSQIENCELIIYNSMGIEVIRKSITKQLTSLETDALQSGIYFYLLKSSTVTLQSGRLISYH